MKNLIKIAKKARCLTEVFASKHAYIGNTKNLGGYCAIGSKIILLLAEKTKYKGRLNLIQGYYGFKSEAFVWSEQGKIDCINHCWVSYKNMIVDITYTQFVRSNLAVPVYVTPASNDYYLNILKNERFDEMWKDQNPGNYTEELRELVSL